MAKKKDKIDENAQDPITELGTEEVKPMESTEKPVETPIEENKPKESTEKIKADITGKPMVPLAVFCKLSGKKPDQMAGFRSYAKRYGLKPMTIPQWKEKFVEFQNKPMR